MAIRYVITSGKGGVGKTTVTTNIGIYLAGLGYRVLLVDGDFGLNNLDVLTLVENRSAFSLVDAINGRCRVRQTLIASPLSSNLFILPSTKTSGFSEITAQKLKEALDGLDGLFDFIFIDCPAGIDVGFHRAVSVCDNAIVVVTPTIPSVRDADKVIQILKSYPVQSVKILVNRIRGDLVLSGDSLSVEDVSSTLKIDVLGVVPDDDYLQSGKPSLSSRDSSKAFRKIALSLTGKPVKPYDYIKKYTGFWGSIRKELKKRL